MATLFNDKIFADLAFQQVVDLLSPINAFATDISNLAKAPGDSVTVSLVGNTTTTTFTQAADVMEQTGGAITAVTVTLNARKITPVDLTSQQLLDSANASRMELFAMQLAESTASTVLSELFSVFTTSNFGTAVVTTASGNFKLDAIAACRAALNAKNCPRLGRALVLDDACEVGLTADTNILLANSRGNTRALEEANFGRLLGFDIFTTSVMPLNSISLIGVACGRAGVAVAMRQIADVLPGEEYAAVERLDHESGISMTYTRHWSRAQAKWFINMQALYGYSKAVTKQVTLICTATT